MKLHPDEAMIRSFIGHLHGAYKDPSTKLAIRCLKDGKSTEQRFKLSELDTIVEFVTAHNKAGFNCYVTHASVKSNFRGKAVSDNDMASAAFIVADGDDRQASENIKNHNPRPWIILHTGGDRYWGFFRVDNNATNKNTYNKRSKALNGKLCTDSAVANISRIVPVAGTVRWQPESKKAKGYVDGLITFEYAPGQLLDTGILVNPRAKFMDAIDCYETLIFDTKTL